MQVKRGIIFSWADTASWHRPPLRNHIHFYSPKSFPFAWAGLGGLDCRRRPAAGSHHVYLEMRESGESSWLMCLAEADRAQFWVQSIWLRLQWWTVTSQGRLPVSETFVSGLAGGNDSRSSKPSLRITHLTHRHHNQWYCRAGLALIFANWY